MDLFEFFQKQERQLREMPSEQVWQRLEALLEQRRKRRKRRNIRFLQIEAILVVLMLLLMAAALVWYFARREGL